MRVIALAISVVFHPLLMLTYGFVLLALANPFVFGYANFKSMVPLVIITLAYTFFLPLISILFMKTLGLVKSLELKTREERVGPLIVCIIFYAWYFINMYYHSNMPPALGVFALGCVIALSISFFISLFEKVSLHTVGLGGLFGLILILLRSFNYRYLELLDLEVHLKFILVVVLVLTGVVGSGRIFLQAHVQKDLYGGFIIGLASQFIAMRILL